MRQLTKPADWGKLGLYFFLHGDDFGTSFCSRMQQSLSGVGAADVALTKRTWPREVKHITCAVAGRLLRSTQLVKGSKSARGTSFRRPDFQREYNDRQTSTPGEEFR
ncbi:hypothetical protein R1sor_004686 [Riccia sorocarpa]|uniref:Uncharacterized protein n=1 Tax=Riccia sorocarpa TaxID=122646 RepID=A0ABD3HHD9_9MARC